jgi:hypothetical protein
MEPALSESLMEAMLSSGNVREAWRRVKSNGGAAGVDGTTVGEFVAKIRSSWVGIREYASTRESGGFKNSSFAAILKRGTHSAVAAILALQALPGETVLPRKH